MGNVVKVVVAVMGGPAMEGICECVAKTEEICILIFLVTTKYCRGYHMQYRVAAALCCRSDAANLNACVADFISFSFRPNQMRINENNMHGQKGSAFVLRYSHFFFLRYCVQRQLLMEEEGMKISKKQKSMLQFNSHRTEYFGGCANEMSHSRHLLVYWALDPDKMPIFVPFFIFIDSASRQMQRGNQIELHQFAMN